MFSVLGIYFCLTILSANKVFDLLITNKEGVTEIM